MFDINQIHEVSSKVKSGADFPQYVQNLKSIGVLSYDNFVSDGHTVYYGSDNFVLEAPAKYPEIPINESSSTKDLEHAIGIHQQGETDYPTFCQQAADAGVNKWTTQLVQMKVTYFNKKGQPMLEEPIPSFG